MARVKVTTYFHGGVPGLQPGGQLLPPSHTGTPCGADVARAVGVTPPRRDRVYLAHHADEARVYASLAGGDLYEVEAEGEVEPDLDGVSVHCASARVRKVVERQVPMSAALSALRAAAGVAS